MGVDDPDKLGQQMPKRTSTLIRRKLDDVEDEVNYWKQKAGWYDDDASMISYNENAQEHRSNPSWNTSGSSESSSSGGGSIIWNLIGVAVMLVSFAALILIARAIKRKLDRSKSKSQSDDKDGKSRKRSKSKKSRDSTSRRSRRGSRSSRSRSRSRRSSRVVEGDYELMEDKEPSKRSRSRSKSRSSSRRRSSRSRSRARTRNIDSSDREIV